MPRTHGSNDITLIIFEISKVCDKRNKHYISEKFYSRNC